MRSYKITATAAALLAGLSVVSASYPLAIITPCPSCPKSVCPELITVTSQYQPVSTCKPMTSTGAKNAYKVTPSCSTYDYVSTVIPCLGGNTTVTSTDQMVTISHMSTILTSYSTVAVPCPTKGPTADGSKPQYPAEKCSSTSTQYQTMVVDTSCPYNKIGPLAIPHYEGSGLCKDCMPDLNETQSQGVEVNKCVNGVCSTYAETWVSRKPAPATSASAATYSSSASCSAGVNTIPVTTTCTPTGGAYSIPVTSSFAITTSVAKPQTVAITKTFTVYFTGEAPKYPASTSAAQVSAATHCSENGVQTIPIVQTYSPTNSAYAPVTTTVMYTTTVSNAPVDITCHTSVTVSFTTPFCPETIRSGSTVQPTTYPTYPASAPAYPTNGQTAGSYPTYPVTTAAPYPTSKPSSPSTVGSCDFVGCVGSSEGFPTFNLVESSGLMTLELCTSECNASGYTYAGLFTTECYCAHSLSYGTSADKATGVCDIPCPGNSLESCGGHAQASYKLRNRAASNAYLLDVYECPTPTTTSSTTSSTESSTYSSTPEPSSDADPMPEPRNIHADMESSAAVKARDDVKMRRGGMLRNVNNIAKGPGLAKRDYGLKKNALI